ncbi:MAG TPA: DbpA RNA binding domain-containing protein [Gemmatimonadales bacterium]|nr:DbpA RNA binding domain-containing protein [Gemmatimonadales bacterium]
MKAERSRHVVLVVPPAVERAGEVWASIAPGHGPGDHTPAPSVVVVCADHEAAAQWAAAAPAELRAHAVTGLVRSAALLKEGRVGLLAGAPADLAALVARSALKLDSVETVVLAWPETFADSLDALLAEAPEARRIVLSWNPAALSDFLERHARRAEMRGSLALGAVSGARYAVVSGARREAAARDVLNQEPDAALCKVLPTPEELAERAKAGQPVVLVTAAQLPYLQAIATLRPIALPGAADRAQDRAAALRARIAARLEAGNVDAELALLEPLFERYDPAEVAGALLGLQRETGHEKRDTSAQVPPDGTVPWVKVFVTVGKKDRAGAKDLVGALIREVGLEKGQIGRIEVRETHSLVEVAPAVVERAVRGLGGVSIRGRRVSARVDRSP